MKLRGKWRRLLGGWLLATGMGGLSGCLGCLHPIGPPGKDLIGPCQAIPQCARNHVYIFLLNGVDPLDFSNLAGVRAYLHHLGFIKTYSGQCYHAGWFASELERIHKEEPDARFALVGSGLGADKIWELAHQAEKDGVHFQLLMCLGARLGDKSGHDFLSGCRVINVQTGTGKDRAVIAGAENVEILDAGQFSSLTHPEIMNLLAQELMALAASLPEAAPIEMAPPEEPELGPTPRPVKIPQITSRDGWDFLKPVSRLRLPEFKEKPKEEKPPAPKPEKITSLPATPEPGSSAGKITPVVAELPDDPLK